MERISVQDHRAVYERLCKDYLNLKLLAQNACHGPERLERCKQSVRQDIHSCRKLSRITQFEQLVALMEQRNLISLLKPDLIERFVLALDTTEVGSALTSYRDALRSHYEPVRRFYLEDLRHRDRRTLLEKEVERIKLQEATEPPAVTPTAATNAKCDAYLRQREGIYSLLQLEIGKSWKVFGRFLNVPVGELDEIEERNRQDLKTRIYETLERAEMQYDDAALDQYVGVLLKALESSRRKDLKRKIETMLQR
uniref:FADD n=1 Tax=Anopheles coluzzii TaxID=1518534 RepID=A0A0D3QD01_ANOCL|nr:FADD [Anopheles coluzzii]AJC98791.1 FADD [Anopheles coluzzii]